MKTFDEPEAMTHVSQPLIHPSICPSISLSWNCSVRRFVQNIAIQDTCVLCKLSKTLFTYHSVPPQMKFCVAYNAIRLNLLGGNLFIHLKVLVGLDQTQTAIYSVICEENLCQDQKTNLGNHKFHLKWNSALTELQSNTLIHSPIVWMFRIVKFGQRSPCNLCLQCRLGYHRGVTFDWRSPDHISKKNIKNWHNRCARWWNLDNR